MPSWELENLKERLKPLGEGSSGKFSSDQAAALQGSEGRLTIDIVGVSQDALGSTQTRGEPGGSHLPGGRVPYPG